MSEIFYDDIRFERQILTQKYIYELGNINIDLETS